MSIDQKEFDNRPGIFLAHEMPDNIKIAPLSDAAFRLIIRAWCYASRVRSDGIIPEQIWKEMGSPKARAELMEPPTLAPKRSPLVRKIPGGVELHDYTKHNRTAEEIKAVSAVRGESGAKGAHARWHVGRRHFDPNCEFCTDGK